eukprot:CAMPEP_0194262984 /NCGR_PEP_ID=MMETSP0158-20130606/46816_1 /TAXON_ID=33649 /ORGANISM="Thalassionema nitzschioides, Strain L26-B" /LENGTH=2209 /DNA_ID=CAMNT_0039003149 /DNA_START=70 /DNA_END=6701 /DNA_ORIENTATION=-
MTRISSLEDLFHRVSTLVRETPATAELQVSNDDKLRLYGSYKHVTCGPCKTHPPSILQPIERAKHLAWKSNNEQSKHDSMLIYVQVAAEQNNWVGRECKNMLLEWSKYDANQIKNAPCEEQNDSICNENDRNEKDKEDEVIKKYPAFVTSSAIKENSAFVNFIQLDPNFMERFFRLKSILPRGQLDISFGQLANAARHCSQYPTLQKVHATEKEICCHWHGNSADDDMIVGLSVRSLFDLYLRAKCFPAGSKIIMSPPINIPGMMSVLDYHQLEVIAIDLPESFESDYILRIDIDQIGEVVKETISSKNKIAAFMVVNPFGIQTATQDDMKKLRVLADEYNFDILDDSAECYSQEQPLECSQDSDLTFISFGPIKTSTALGGGVAILPAKNGALSKKMRQLHESLYPHQTQKEYLLRVLGAFITKFIASTPLLYGLIYKACQLLNIPFDTAVTFPTRSFATPYNLSIIRRRPSLALLSLMANRLQKKDVHRNTHTKVTRCQEFYSLISPVSNVVQYPRPAASCRHAYWLAPIIVASPQDTSDQLLNYHGFDVPRGLSQLCCIKKTGAPRTQRLMNSILYLPVSSRTDMSRADLERLALALESVLVSKIDTKISESTLDYRSEKRVILLMLTVLLLQFVPGILCMCLRVLEVAILIFVLKLGIEVALTFFLANDYVNSSSCFAKYNPMLKNILQKERRVEAENEKVLSEVSALNFVPGDDDDETKTSLLITGVTGFLGSCILHQLLYCKAFKASVDRVVVICRPKHGKSAKARVDELLDQNIFSLLTKEEKQNLIVVLEGDVSKPHAGLSTKDLNMLKYDLQIQSIINCAASVGFVQSLDEAAGANITSALHLHNLSMLLNAKFVQISTAFVHGALTGTQLSPLPETLFDFRSFDPNRIYTSMIGNQIYASSAMTALKFPNTYTFSKCICEHLLFQQGRDNVIIIRPSIIGPSLCSPFEGWSGQKPSTIVAATCLYTKMPLSIWCFGKEKAPVVPVDVVARFVLVKAFKLSSHSSKGPIENKTRYEKPLSTEKVEVFHSINEIEHLLAQQAPLSTEKVEVFHSINEIREADIPSVHEILHGNIFNAAWNVESNDTSLFSWFDFATSVPHFGTVLGYFTRTTCYIGFLVSTKVLPSLSLSQEKFAALYYYALQVPFSGVLKLLNFIGKKSLANRLSKIETYLNLPVLFYPFINNSFHFKSDLQAPSRMEGDRYMCSCITAAHQFLHDRSKKALPKASCVVVAGKNHKKLNSDLTWMLTQPRGNFLVRIIGYFFIKILRASCTSVTVDVESFSSAINRSRSSKGEVDHIILAPAHRSFYDFILLSFVAFSLPEMQVKIPHIAAADTFSRIPLIGWIIEYANVFFLRRGQGFDPDLEKQIRKVKNNSGETGACIEVFIEGSRSRDRRFLRPKTGFLRCLAQTGGNHIIIPICINYEKIPEQDVLTREAISGPKRNISTVGLIKWIKDTLLGKEVIGSIHIAANEPIMLGQGENIDFHELARKLQSRQQELLFVSDYHLKAAEQILGLNKDEISKALRIMGCSAWPETCEANEVSAVFSTAEAWSITSQFSHLIAHKLKITQTFWSEWIRPIKPNNSIGNDEDESVLRFVDAFEKLLDKVDTTVEQAIDELKFHGIYHLAPNHVLDIATSNPLIDSIPDALLLAAIHRRLGMNNSQPDFNYFRNSLVDRSVENKYEELGMWGFHDSRFQVRPDKDGQPTVVMSGNRYSISGKSLRYLIPFIEAETKIKVDVLSKAPRDVVGLEIAECAIPKEKLDLVSKIVSKLSISPATRMRHGTGYSQEDAFDFRHGGRVRVPDVVVWPKTESEVMGLIDFSKNSSCNLIPHGGGTNVSQATRCPSMKKDPRPIISVDMTHMDSVLWINEEDGLAHVQAGITGRVLIQEMKRHGYTIGHEPDSLEFSTLGGWIATKASGMKRSKYGNIEDIVVDIRVASSIGNIWKGQENGIAGPPGRESRGIDLLSCFLGSEGCLGIVVSAIIRIWPLPTVIQHEGVLIPDMDAGIHFVRRIARLGPLAPASVRLLDNAHFRLGQALRENSSIADSIRKLALKALTPKYRAFSSNEMVCATIIFEGSADEVREQRRKVSEIAMHCGGLLVGSRVGRSGYDLTFAIAYLRDFALSYDFLGDSFETFAPWSTLHLIIKEAKKAKRKNIDADVYPDRFSLDVESHNFTITGRAYISTCSSTAETYQMPAQFFRK